MKRHGKKYLKAREKVNREKRCDVEEAIQLVRECAPAKFDETVDMAVRLGVDPKKSDQVVRGAVVLPHGLGKQVRVIVFAKGEKEKEAKEAGADLVGGEDLVSKIQGGWLDFDKAIATPDMMSLVGKLGKILGPRGMMPNPKLGTVTFDIAKAVKEAKAGKVEFKTDKAGLLHIPVGKVSFQPEHLKDNILTLLDAFVRMKPASSKGTYIKGITLSSTMGPGIKIEPSLVKRITQ